MARTSHSVGGRLMQVGVASSLGCLSDLVVVGGHVTVAPSGLGSGQLCRQGKDPRQAGPPTLGSRSRLAPKPCPAVPRTAVRPRGRKPSLPRVGSPGSPGTGTLRSLSLCLPPGVWLSHEGFVDPRAELQSWARAKLGPACALGRPGHAVSVPRPC